MRVRLSCERMNEAHLVGERSEMRHEIGDHLTALPTRTELPRALVKISLRALERDQPLGTRHRLTVPFDELGLVIKRVHLAHCARAENHEHLLRPRREMHRAWGVRIGGIDLRANRSGCSERALLAQQVRERDAAEPGSGVAKKTSAIEERMHDRSLEDKEKLAGVVESARERLEAVGVDHFHRLLLLVGIWRTRVEEAE